MNSLKLKLLIVGLCLSSLIGYIEWNGNNSIFLFKAEYLIFSKLFTDPLSVIHPFTIIPLAGQILLFISLFQNNPSRKLIFTAIVGIGILFIMILIAGILSKNYRIVISVTPFMILSFFTIKQTIINSRKV